MKKADGFKDKRIQIMAKELGIVSLRCSGIPEVVENKHLHFRIILNDFKSIEKIILDRKKRAERELEWIPRKE